MRGAQCGLDKARARAGGAPLALQQEVFCQQLRLGKQLGRPISVRPLPTSALSCSAGLASLASPAFCGNGRHSAGMRDGASMGSRRGTAGLPTPGGRGQAFAVMGSACGKGQ